MLRTIRVGIAAVLLLSGQIIATAQPVAADCAGTLVFVNPRPQGSLTVDLGGSKVRAATHGIVEYYTSISWGPWSRLGSGVLTIPAGAERSRTVQLNKECYTNQLRIRWSDGNDWVDKLYPGHGESMGFGLYNSYTYRVVLPLAATPGSIVGAAVPDPTRAFTGSDGWPGGITGAIEALLDWVRSVAAGGAAETVGGTELAS